MFLKTKILHSFAHRKPSKSMCIFTHTTHIYVHAIQLYFLDMWQVATALGKIFLEVGLK
jgi:hypothetical protein